MAQKTVLIKKYENRRLYDVTNSRYVNLEDVAQILKAGNDVRVIDVATGADITRLILTQIIVEDAKAADSDFPLDILRQMVIASGRASQESAFRYMNALLDFYQNTYRAISPSINPFGFGQAGASVQGNPREPLRDDPSRNAAAGAAERSAAPDSEDVDRLKSRVAELEKIVSSLAPRKPARARTRRKK